MSVAVALFLLCVLRAVADAASTPPSTAVAEPARACSPRSACSSTCRSRYQQKIARRARASTTIVQVPVVRRRTTRTAATSSPSSASTPAPSCAATPRVELVEGSYDEFRERPQRLHHRRRARRALRLEGRRHACRCIGTIFPRTDGTAVGLHGRGDLPLELAERSTSSTMFFHYEYLRRVARAGRVRRSARRRRLSSCSSRRVPTPSERAWPHRRAVRERSAARADHHRGRVPAPVRLDARQRADLARVDRRRPCCSRSSSPCSTR